MTRTNFLSNDRPNYFYIEVNNVSKQNVNVILEFHTKNEIKYRGNFNLFHNWNYISVPFEKFQLDPNCEKHKLMFYIDHDEPVELEFKYLDFVSASDPVPKIKCIAWDLDNTLWRGVIGDDGAENVVVDKSAIDLIERFDELGFIQTIVSKNTHEIAWAKIEELGIADYFVYPAINWQPKSVNLFQIVKKLNIGVDSVAFIDDSEFDFDKSIIKNILQDLYQQASQVE